MIEETIHLSKEIAQLKAVALQQSCNDCTLMQKYITQEYHKLHSKSEAINRLLASNFVQQQTRTIAEIKRSVSILGLYILV